MFWQQSQFTNEQLPICDREVITAKHQQRLDNRIHSEKSKLGKSINRPKPCVNVGNLVYLYSDRNKSKARSHYLVVSLDGDWCFIKKFTGGQLRASSYKVKLAEVYLVPKELRDLPLHDLLPSEDDKVLIEDDNNIQSDIVQPASTNNSHDGMPITFTHSVPEFEEPIIDTPPDTEQEIPPGILATPRPQRSRKPPDYLKDYVCN